MKCKYNDTEWVYTLKSAEDATTTPTGKGSDYPQFELMYHKGGNVVHMKFTTPHGNEYIDIKVNETPDDERVTYGVKLTNNGGFLVCPIAPKWMEDDWRGSTIVYNEGELSITAHYRGGETRKVI